MEFNLSPHRKKIVISLLLESSPKLSDYIFEPNTDFSLRDFPEDILSQCWELSSEDKLLVRVILDIWCGHGNVFLSEIFSGLSLRNRKLVLFALKKFDENEMAFNG